MRVSLSCAVLIVSMTACRQDMHDQPRYEPLERNELFTEGRSARPLIPGTVARGALNADKHLYTGRSDEKQPAPSLFPVSEEELETALSRMAGQALAATFPFAVTRETLEHGRERFEIFCAPCHSRLGYGDGVVVRRGFRQPPSYHSERLREVPVGHFVDVITRGIGAMGDFSDRIPAQDRWAITSYIRALQFSQYAKLEDLPGDLREQARRSTVIRRPEPPPVPSHPLLQVDPAGDLARFQEEQEALFHSYAWVDRERGIVAIPVEQAMSIVIERGFEVRR